MKNANVVEKHTELHFVVEFNWNWDFSAYRILFSVTNPADTAVVKIQVEEVPIFAILCLHFEEMSENYEVKSTQQNQFPLKKIPPEKAMILSSDYYLKSIRTGLFQTQIYPELSRPWSRPVRIGPPLPATNNVYLKTVSNEKFNLS